MGKIRSNRTHRITFRGFDDPGKEDKMCLTCVAGTKALSCLSPSPFVPAMVLLLRN